MFWGDCKSGHVKFALTNFIDGICHEYPGGEVLSSNLNDFGMEEVGYKVAVLCTVGGEVMEDQSKKI